MKMLTELRLTLVSLAILGLLLGTSSCNRRSSESDDVSEEVSEPARDLTFNNITLEQANDAGQLVWRMVADRAVYSQDRQKATIDNPSGEFLRDDEATLKVQAETGEVINDGERIILKGQVVATDVETGAVLRGDEMEWRTNEDLVIVRRNVIGTHPDFTIAADEALAAISEERVEVSGNVVAVSKEDDVQLEGEHLVWWLEEERLVSDRPLQLQQREGRQVTARARGDRAEFNMGTEVASLQQNAVITLQDPPIRVTGDALRWDIASDTVTASEPFSVLQRQEQIRLSADRGTGNLDSQVFRLNGNVVVTAQRNQSRLTANHLTWNIPTEDFVAEGDVVYRQADPTANLRGSRAEGKLNSETIVETVVVTGDRVVTEIIPDPAN